MIRAIAESCDVYFYDLANDMGVEGVNASLAIFGFGHITGLDIGGEASGLLPSPAWKLRRSGEAWYGGETLILGIGQGYILVTPMQLAVATAALANRGKLYRPHLLAEVTDSETGTVVESFSPRLQAEIRIHDEAYWDEVVLAMHQVVQGSGGTARGSGFGAKYKFAGKTGTAQIVSLPQQDEEYDPETVPEELRDHALFIAFAPLQNPRIAIVVIVENGGSGSSGAAPIARRLFDYYLLDHKRVSARGGRG